MSVAKPGRVAYVNARVLDPASNHDGPGEVLTSGEEIVDVGRKLFDGKLPADVTVVDCQGHCIGPGLVDMRVQLREPGEEHKESLKSACEAAVASGVTTMVCLPNTNPIMDDEPTLEFVARRARAVKPARPRPPRHRPRRGPSHDFISQLHPAARGHRHDGKPAVHVGAGDE